MEFFNKKEEVIEIIMTQKGKELFSAGNFNPTYYSFHDMDVTYENNNNEEQNSTVPRIKETPTLKSVNGLVQEKKYYSLKNSFKSKDKQFLLKNEIGSKTFKDQYSPSWNLNFLSYPPFQYVGPDRDHIQDLKHYEISVISNMSGEKSYQELIPQLNIQTVYQVVELNDTKKNKYSYEFEKQNLYDYSSFGYEFLKIFIDKNYEIEFSIEGDLITFTKIIDGEKVSTNFALSSLNQYLKEKYLEQLFKLTNLMKEYFSLKIDTANDFIKILKDGFKTEFIYNFSQIKEINEKFKSFIFDIKLVDFFGEIFTPVDENEKPLKYGFKLPKYIIKQSKWLSKDPRLVISFEELNCFESNEFSEFELEFYLIDEEKNQYKRMEINDINRNLKIYLDSAANFIIADKLKNNYQEQEADDSLC